MGLNTKGSRARVGVQVYISSKTWAGPGRAPEGCRRNLRRMPAFEGLAPDGSVLFAQDQVGGSVISLPSASFKRSFRRQCFACRLGGFACQ